MGLFSIDDKDKPVTRQQLNSVSDHVIKLDARIDRLIAVLGYYEDTTYGSSGPKPVILPRYMTVRDIEARLDRLISVLGLVEELVPGEPEHWVTRKARRGERPRVQGGRNNIHMILGAGELHLGSLGNELTSKPVRVKNARLTVKGKPPRKKPRAKRRPK